MKFENLLLPFLHNIATHNDILHSLTNVTVIAYFKWAPPPEMSLIIQLAVQQDVSLF